MELNYKIENNEGCISFIPFRFLYLKEVLKGYNIKKIERLEINIFKENKDLYIDLENYLDYFSNVKTFDDIIAPFLKMEEEDYSIYKMDIIFDKITLMYDDDSYLTLGRDIITKEDYSIFNNLYVQVFNIYMESGYLLDE